MARGADAILQSNGPYPFGMLEHNNYLCSGDTKPLRVQISRQFLCLTSIKPYKYRIRISRYIW